MGTLARNGLKNNPVGHKCHGEKKKFMAKKYHCVKSVRTRSFSGVYFPTLKPEKLRIGTLFTQCTSQ